MAIKTYSLTYFNEFGEECDATFKTNEYHSLMELLFDKYIEDWGDCKGRAWCGTCHIQIIEGSISEKIGVEEKKHPFQNRGCYGKQSLGLSDSGKCRTAPSGV